MRKSFVAVFVLLVAMLSLFGCQPKVLRLATTTSTYDSGLLDAILPVFEKEAGVKVEVLAKGTGEAIALGSRGDVDVVLVHARSQEDAFVEAGDGIDRRDVMYNDFVIVGPASDPAGIKGGSDAVKAMQQLAASNSVFISRGDNSGTHTKEKGLWTAAGVADKGTGYKEAGLGMGDALRMTDEMQGYTLSDRATYLALQDSLSLQVVVEGDPLLFNPYGVIAVNPEKHQDVNYQLATRFIEWITSEQGQQLIGEYGKDKYGQALFTPNYQGE